jgi:hypothetical protein
MNMKIDVRRQNAPSGLTEVRFKSDSDLSSGASAKGGAVCPLSSVLWRLPCR